MSKDEAIRRVEKFSKVKDFIAGGCYLLSAGIMIVGIFLSLMLNEKANVFFNDRALLLCLIPAVIGLLVDQVEMGACGPSDAPVGWGNKFTFFDKVF